MGGPLDCDRAIEAASAASDGELGRAERALLDEHLAGCADCARTVERFALVDRRVRLRPAEAVPDLVGPVTDRLRPAVLGRGGWLRPALAWVAVVLAVRSAPALVLGEAAGADVHLARHLGAFGLALAIGFAYVAWRPHRAFGLLPLVAALVVSLALSAAFDLADGDRSAAAELAHVPELVGLALLWMIAGSPGRPTRRRATAGVRHRL